VRWESNLGKEFDALRVQSNSWEEVQKGGWANNEVSAADEAARKAAAEADEAAKEVAGDTGLSIRQLDAMDRRATAETNKEFQKQAKIEEVSNAMDKVFSAGIKEVTQYRVRETARDKRAEQAFNRKMDKLLRETERDGDGTGADDVERAARKERKEELDGLREDAADAKAWRKLNKQEYSSLAREKTQQKRLAEQEGATSMRLWEEAGAMGSTLAFFSS